jgi:vacuolar-type H+-ATPase subunit C/Vma6
MSGRWTAVNARVRGLGTHLIGRAALEGLARTPDLAALATRLQQLGLAGADDGTSPAALDRALRRHAARELRILARWASDRPEVIAVVFDDEDRRSLRSLLRGAAQGAAAAERLAGLIPTPTLPERALSELANQPTPARVAALLVAWRHPYGSPLLAASSGAQADLFRLEIALSREFAARALAAVRRRGASLERYVRESIDLENAATVLVLAEQGEDTTPKDAFIEGGARLGVADFERAAATASPMPAARILARILTGAPAEVLERVAGGGDSGRLEPELLRARIRSLVRAARLDPLGPEPFLIYALRLRAQMLDVRRIMWGLVLGAPAEELRAGLVSA